MSSHLKPKHFLFLLFLVVTHSLAAQKKTSRPNIIYIMTDDLGYADLSCYGRTTYQTPHLDQLASQGMKFMNAYATAPVCTPTRVSFMTGRYPARIEVGLHEPLDWSTKDSLSGLSSQQPTVASLLKKGGYETYLVGKWHLGFKPQFNPMHNGFDYFYGFHAGAIDYISHTDPKGNNDLYENDQPVKKEGYITDLWKDKTNEIIAMLHDKPFFIALMFNAPHWPWQAPGDQKYPDSLGWRQGGSPAVYAAMMKSLDDAVGSIMKTLDEKNLSGNTIVIFTSDNGGERFSDNGMYKGQKMDLWEGGIREPAFVRWPGKIKPAITQQVSITMDWTATILAAAGVAPDPASPLDGINLMPVLTGAKKTTDRTLYWRISQRKQQKAMRSGKWKYLKDEKGAEYLFDLEKDPAEKNNLKTVQPAEFETLKNKYKQWEASVLPPLPLIGDTLK